MTTAPKKRQRDSDLPSVLDPAAAFEDGAPEGFTENEVPTMPPRQSGTQRTVLPRTVTEVDARRGRRTDPREE